MRNEDTQVQQDTKPVRIGDRRRTVRRAPKFAFADVWWSVDTFVEGRVLNESADGIGVQVAWNVPIEEGFLVYVERNGEARGAKVVHATENQNSQLTLGLAWHDEMPLVKFGVR